MAKNNFVLACIFLLYCCSSGCVLKANLTDTPPDQAINPTAPVEVLPIEPELPAVDTISKSTVVIKPVNPKKPDTVKQTIVIYQPAKTVEYKRSAVQRVYISQIGVREKTGKNDGVEVEMYLRSVGLGKGNPYCAAGVHWSLAKGGVPNPITGWSPTALNKKALVWFGNKWVTTPKTADVFVLFYPSLGRIGHTGFWDKQINPTVYESVEFNTNEQNSREGQGVYRRKRSYHATYGISRWIN